MDINMESKNKFIVIILNQSTDEESFVIPNAEEITLCAETDNIKYYFNDSVSIYTFETKKDFKYLKDSLGWLFEDLEIEHILLPYDEDNMNIFLPKHVTKHIFPTYNSRSSLSDSFQPLNNDDESFKEFIESQGFLSDYDDDDEDEIDTIFKQIRKKKIPLNQILDKIVDYGINTLTEEEKRTLQTYSK
jgi:hypothetical protein